MKSSTFEYESLRSRIDRLTMSNLIRSGKVILYLNAVKSVQVQNKKQRIKTLTTLTKERLTTNMNKQTKT